MLGCGECLAMLGACQIAKTFEELAEIQRKPGNRETGKPGNRETGKPGNRETGKPGNPRSNFQVSLILG
jgi:hypothetical protein